MNIFGFRPFKGKFNLGNSDDIPENQDGTLIGSIKQINASLPTIANTFYVIKSVSTSETVLDTFTVSSGKCMIISAYIGYYSCQPTELLVKDTTNNKTVCYAMTPTTLGAPISIASVLPPSTYELTARGGSSGNISLTETKLTITTQ